MDRKKTVLRIGFILVAAFGAGCTHTAERHSFPAAWPAGLTWTGETRPASVVPVEPSGPAVAVEPFALDAEGVRDSTAGPGSTSRALTNLMTEKLRQAGVRVSDSDAEYSLAGTVSKLGYTQRSGYPRKLYYTSELVYRLTHRPTGAVVWEGTLRRISSKRCWSTR